MRRDRLYCSLIIFSNVVSILRSSCSEEKFYNYSQALLNGPQQPIREYALQRLRLRNTHRLPLLVPEQPTDGAPTSPMNPPTSYNNLALETRDYITSLLDERSIWALAHVSRTENFIAVRFIPLVLTPQTINQNNLFTHYERYARVRELLIRSGAQERLRPYQIPLIARFFPRITRLGIHNTCITTSLAQALSESNTFINILHFDLSTSSFEANSRQQVITYLAQANFAPCLQTINFSRTGFSKTEGCALSIARAFPALQKLNLSHNPEGDVYVLSSIAYMAFTPHLKVLKMANMGLSQGWKLVPLKQKAVHMQNSVCEQHVPTFMNIKVLDVSHNALGDISIKNCVIDAVFAPKLTTLVLANTGITALGIKYLVEIKTLIKLKKLDLSYNNLGESINQLAQTIFADQLRVLNLAGIDTTNQALLSCVESMPNLEILIISDNNQLSFAGITQLIENLSKLKKLIIRNLALKQEAIKLLKEQTQKRAVELFF